MNAQVRVLPNGDLHIQAKSKPRNRTYGLATTVLKKDILSGTLGIDSPSLPSLAGSQELYSPCEVFRTENYMRVDVSGLIVVDQSFMLWNNSTTKHNDNTKQVSETSPLNPNRMWETYTINEGNHFWEYTIPDGWSLRYQAAKAISRPGYYYQNWRFYHHGVEVKWEGAINDIHQSDMLKLIPTMPPFCQEPDPAPVKEQPVTEQTPKISFCPVNVGAWKKDDIEFVHLQFKGHQGNRSWGQCCDVKTLDSTWDYIREHANEPSFNKDGSHKYILGIAVLKVNNTVIIASNPVNLIVKSDTSTSFYELLAWLKEEVIELDTDVSHDVSWEYATPM